MRLVFSCPSCQGVVLLQDVEKQSEICCNYCSWKKEIPAEKIVNEKPQSCLVCGCDDLWRQKDFPVALGLTMVGLGILISTIFYAYYRPELALGVLMIFALIDMALYFFMKDVLVCYRCASRHRSDPINDDDPAFDLEVAERYRQQAIKENQITSQNPSP